MGTLTRALFRFQGVTYIDSPKDDVLAQHVLRLTIAVAHQPYKVCFHSWRKGLCCALFQWEVLGVRRPRLYVL